MHLLRILRGIIHLHRFVEHTKRTGKSSNERLLTQLSSYREESPYAACELLLGKSSGKCLQQKIEKNSNKKTCKQGFGEEREAESRTEKPTQLLQGAEHLLGRDLGSPDSAAEDPPIIHAGIGSQHGKHQ